ncbi:MAG: hypothetical protein ACTSSH_01675 [Candidatus Heimdallarchaeota archaeon]
MTPSKITILQQKRKADIVTVGCEDQLQKRNTLKGLAMQKMVRYTMGKKEEDISVKRIFEELSQKQVEYFIVEKSFKTQKEKFTHKWRYVHLDDFDDYLEIWIREQTIDRNWKICNHCGLTISASDQFSKKCRKCKKGWYQALTKKINRWVILNKGAKRRMIDLLVKEGCLKALQIRKRLDFFHYANNVFSIIEVKNKEKSGLSSRDLRKTLIYPFIVSRCGYTVKKLVLIYNGKITKELLRELSKGFGKDLPFEVELIHVRDFLLRNAIYIQGIRVSIIDEQYHYKIIPGQAKRITIDLTQID